VEVGWEETHGCQVPAGSFCDPTANDFGPNERDVTNPRRGRECWCFLRPAGDKLEEIRSVGLDANNNSTHLNNVGIMTTSLNACTDSSDEPAQ